MKRNSLPMRPARSMRKRNSSDNNGATTSGPMPPEYEVLPKHLLQQFQDVVDTGLNLNTLRIRFLLEDSALEGMITAAQMGEILGEFNVKNAVNAEFLSFQDAVRVAFSHDPGHNVFQVLGLMETMLVDFNKYDANQDGVIEPNDLLNYLVDTRMYGATQVTKKMVREVFEQADFNDDGGISFHEWVQWLSGLDMSGGELPKNPTAEKLVQQGISFFKRKTIDLNFDETALDALNKMRSDFNLFHDDNDSVTALQVTHLCRKNGLNPPVGNLGAKGARISFVELMVGLFPNNEPLVKVLSMEDPDVNEIKAVYDSWDTDGDGTLTANEILANFRGSKHRRFVPRGMWLMFNEDRSQTITFSKFCFLIFRNKLEESLQKEVMEGGGDAADAQQPAQQAGTRMERLIRGTTVASELKLRSMQDNDPRFKRSGAAARGGAGGGKVSNKDNMDATNRARLRELEEKIRQLEQAIKDLEKQNEDASSKAKDLEAQLAAAERDAHSAKQQVSSLEQETQQRQQLLTTTKANTQQTSQRLRQAQEMVERLKGEVEEGEREVRAWRERGKRLEDEVNAARREREQLSEAMSKAHDTSVKDQKALSQKITELNSLLEQLKAEKQKVEDDAHTTMSSLHSLQLENETHTTTLQQTQQQLKENEVLVTELTERRERAEKELSMLREEVVQLRKDGNRVALEMKEATFSIERLQSDIERLNAEKALLEKSFQDQLAALQSVHTSEIDVQSANAHEVAQRLIAERQSAEDALRHQLAEMKSSFEAVESDLRFRLAQLLAEGETRDKDNAETLRSAMERAADLEARLQQAEAEVRETTKRLERAGAEAETLRAEHDALMKQWEESERQHRAVETSNTLAQAQTKQLEEQLLRLTTENARLQQTLTERLAELKGIRDENEKNSLAAEEANQRVQEAEGKLAALKEEVTNLQHERQSTTSEFNSVTQQLSTSVTQCKTLQIQITTLHTTIEELRIQLQTAETRAREAQDETTQFSVERVACETEIAQLKIQLQSASEELQQQQQVNADLTETIHSLEESLADKTSTFELLEKRVSDIAAELAAAQQQRDSLLMQHDTVRDEAQGIVAEMHTRLASVESENEVLHAEVERLQGEIARLEGEIELKAKDQLANSHSQEVLNSQLLELESLRSQLQAMETQHAGTQSEMQQLAEQNQQADGEIQRLRAAVDEKHKQLEEALAKANELQARLTEIVETKAVGASQLQDELESSTALNLSLKERLIALEKENQIMDDTSKLLQEEVWRLQKEVSEAEVAAENALARVAELEAQIKAANSAEQDFVAAQAKKGSADGNNHARVLTLEKRIKDLETEKRELLLTAQQHTNRVTELDKRCEMREQEKRVLLAQKAALEDEKMVLEREREALDELRNSLTRQVQKLLEEKSRIEEERMDLELQTDALQHELSQLRSERANIVEHAAQLEQQAAQRLRDLKRDANDGEGKLGAKLEEVQASLKKETMENTRLSQQVTELTQRLQKETGEHTKLTERLDDATKKYNLLKDEVDRLALDNSRLREEMTADLKREKEKNLRLQEDLKEASKSLKYASENKRLQQEIDELNMKIAAADGKLKAVQQEALSRESNLAMTDERIRMVETRLFEIYHFIRNSVGANGVEATRLEDVIEQLKMYLQEQVDLRRSLARRSESVDYSTVTTTTTTTTKEDFSGLRKQIEHMMITQSGTNDSLAFMFETIQKHHEKHEICQMIVKHLTAIKVNEEVSTRVISVGGISLLLRVMREHITIPKFQIVCCISLANLCSSPSLRGAFANAAGVSCATDTLQHYHTSNNTANENPNVWFDVQFNCIKLLLTVCVDRTIRQQIADAGALEEIVAAMVNCNQLVATSAPSSSSGTLLHMGCWAIGRLCGSDKSMLSRFERCSREGVGAVVQAMSLYQDNVELLYEACKMLSTVSVVDGVRTQIGQQGGISSILEAVRKHTQHTTLNHCACWALASLCVDPHTRSLFVQSQGISTLLSVMQRHVAHAETMHQACRAVVNLSVDEEIAGHICDAQSDDGATDGVECVVNALKQHPAHAKLQAVGAWALAHLAVKQQARERIVASGGLSTVVTAMRTQQKDEDLQKCACWVFSHVCNSAVAVQAIASEEDPATVVSAILEAMKRFPANADVQKFGVMAVAMMAADKNLAQCAKRAEGVSIVSAAMRTHPLIPALQQHGTKAITHLSSA